jgi:hypothetical protein
MRAKSAAYTAVVGKDWKLFPCLMYIRVKFDEKLKTNLNSANQSNHILIYIYEAVASGCLCVYSLITLVWVVVEKN